MFMPATAFSAEEALNTAVAGVLSRMTAGVGITMIVAALVAALGWVPLLFSGALGWVIVFSPLVISLALMVGGESLTESQIKIAYLAFAGAMGLSLSLLFALYTNASIAQALVGTTVSFAALAGWGYFTKRDLSSWGAFLFAGVIGLIVAGVVNIFLSSSVLQLVVNVLALVIFLGLTAYDMQRIRDLFWHIPRDQIARQQWFGALSLYINFINIFVSLLQLTGTKSND